MVKLPFVAVAALSMIAVAVGCATPQIGSIANGDDDDTGSAASNSTTTGGTVTDAGVTTTTPTLIPGTSACYSTCLGPASPAAAYEACRANCADAACETSCFNTSCAGANATTCNTAISTCQASCQGSGTPLDAGTTTPTTNPAARDCTNQCVAQTPAIQYWGCTVQNCGATPGQCDDQCFDNSICGQSQQNAAACDTIIQNCATRCQDTLPQF